MKSITRKLNPDSSRNIDERSKKRQRSNSISVSMEESPRKQHRRAITANGDDSDDSDGLDPDDCVTLHKPTTVDQPLLMYYQSQSESGQLVELPLGLDPFQMLKDALKTKFGNELLDVLAQFVLHCTDLVDLCDTYHLPSFDSEDGGFKLFEWKDAQECVTKLTVLEILCRNRKNKEVIAARSIGALINAMQDYRLDVDVLLGVLSVVHSIADAVSFRKQKSIQQTILNCMSRHHICTSILKLGCKVLWFPCFREECTDDDECCSILADFVTEHQADVEFVTEACITLASRLSSNSLALSDRMWAVIFGTMSAHVDNATIQKALLGILLSCPEGKLPSIQFSLLARVVIHCLYDIQVPKLVLCIWLKHWYPAVVSVPDSCFESVMKSMAEYPNDCEIQHFACQWLAKYFSLGERGDAVRNSAKVVIDGGGLNLLFEVIKSHNQEAIFDEVVRTLKALLVFESPMPHRCSITGSS